MDAADIDEILQLPVEERLRLVQLIWESVAAAPAAFPLGDAQRRVIEQRLSDYERNPDEVVSRDTVLAEARRS